MKSDIQKKKAVTAGAETTYAKRKMKNSLFAHSIQRSTEKVKSLDEDTYNVAKAIENQRKYCETNDVPMFIETDGICYRCRKNIFEPFISVGDTCGFVSGITKERAGKALITSCPHCRYTFVD